MKIIIDCPPPPSTNRLWRYGKGHVYRSPEYERWRTEFVFHYRTAYPRGPLGALFTKIKGPFDVEILISSKRRDVDNNAKALLDITQDIGLVENDKLARRVVQERVEKDKAPLGCRITLIALEKENGVQQKALQRRPKKENPGRKTTRTSKAAVTSRPNQRRKKENKSAQG